MTRNSGPVSNDPRYQETNPSALSRRSIGIAKRRESPRFMLCDASMRVLFASADLEYIASSEDRLQALKPQCRESTRSKTIVFHAYDDETVFRIVPLNGHLFACVAIFVDGFSRRGSILKAAKQFGLTKREVEVLQMLIRCKSNLDIAETLCVAESTVGDHVKSVMRKLGASKRAELIGKVFNLDQDLSPGHDD